MAAYIGYAKDIAGGGYGIGGVGRKRGARLKRYSRNKKKAGGSAYSTKPTPGSKRYDPGTTRMGLMKYTRS